jgi:DNA-binding NarL/FixJ family response regulator
MRRHRILLVEDDEPTRARLAEAIAVHSELEVQAAVASCAEARKALDDGPAPDVLLTDLGLPDGSGVDLIRHVRDRGTQAMVITVFGDEKHVLAAIEAGAMGYLLKDGSAEYIGRSILELIAGGSPISPPIARSILRRFRTEPASPVRPEADAPRLTERESEVLTLIVKGFSYAESARLMGVQESTVTSHVRSIYRKLEVHSRGEAVYEALQLGLVKLDG